MRLTAVAHHDAAGAATPRAVRFFARSAVAAPQRVHGTGFAGAVENSRHSTMSSKPGVVLAAGGDASGGGSGAVAGPSSGGGGAAAAASAPTAAAAADVAAMPSATSAVEFLTLLQRLKTTKRTGWVRCNVQLPESVADHSYRMAMMALLLGDGAAAGVDAARCLRMALVHDAAESLVGDITPHCGVSDADKHAREAAAIARMQAMLGEHTRAARELGALWHEYEAQATGEARLVKDFDKLEMVLQAAEYEAAQGLDLQQFFDSTAGRFTTPTGKAWAAEIVALRAQAREAPVTTTTTPSGAAAKEE